MTTWSKSSWRTKPRIQMPDYPDQAALKAVEAQLARYPLLVFGGEANRLKRHLGAAGRGEAFLLQGGDGPDGRPIRETPFGQYRNGRWC